MHYPAAVVAESGQRTTIIIHIEQPDIILVEQMDDINCLALFFNVRTHKIHIWSAD